MALHRAAYDTSAPNAKRKYPDEGEADEEEIEEYKVRKRGKVLFSSVVSLTYLENVYVVKSM